MSSVLFTRRAVIPVWIIVLWARRRFRTAGGTYHRRAPARRRGLVAPAIMLTVGAKLWNVYGATTMLDAHAASVTQTI